MSTSLANGKRTWAARGGSDLRKLDLQAPALDSCMILEASREHPGSGPDGHDSARRRDHRQCLPGVNVALIVVDPEREQVLRLQTHGMDISLQSSVSAVLARECGACVV